MWRYLAPTEQSKGIRMAQVRLKTANRGDRLKREWSRRDKNKFKRKDVNDIIRQPLSYWIWKSTTWTSASGCGRENETNNQSGIAGSYSPSRDDSVTFSCTANSRYQELSGPPLFKYDSGRTVQSPFFAAGKPGSHRFHVRHCLHSRLRRGDGLATCGHFCSTAERE